MLKRVKTYFYDNILDKSQPLEYRVYMIFLLESYFISILSATTNTLLGKGLLGIIFQWTFIALSTLLLFMSRSTRLKTYYPVLLIVSFIYIPFLFFQTAGYDGTALFFAPLAFFLVSITFRGKIRIFLVGANIFEWVVCILIQYFNPSLIIAHNTPFDKLLDLLVALILSLAGLSIMSASISNAFTSTNEQLEELSKRDALTKVYNRRYLDWFLETELSSCKENNKTLSVLLFDLDDFKKINDTYGHGFGDIVLVEFAAAIQSTLRPYDVLTRFGGEEFVVILHNIELKEALDIAERGRKAVHSLKFRNDIQISVSIGVALSRPEDTMSSILDRADKCLYEAKHRGKNQVYYKDFKLL